MSRRTTAKEKSSSLVFNNNTLATAVATVMFSSTVAAAQFYLHTDATMGNGTGRNATTDYVLDGNATLTANSTMSVYYGTIDGYGDGDDIANEGQVIIAGNLTMHGNIGSVNATGNFTINAGNTLTLASNVSTFNSDNFTIGVDSTLNLGNTTTGYNRGSTDTLAFSTNVSMASGGTINVGNGTTLSGSIYGLSDGVGTLNVHGNVTSGGVIGGDTKANVGASDLAVINVSEGNTLTLSHESSATNYYINGTVTNSAGLDANMTGNVKLGASGILNLNNVAAGTSINSDNTSRVHGKIDGVSSGVGTLNINGTFTTNGQIGRDYKLAAINLSTATVSKGYSTTFAHDVNATTITVGTSSSQTNATLKISAGDPKQIDIIGNIVGGGNSTATDNAAGGIFHVAGNATVNGSIGSAAGRFAEIKIQDGATLTILGSAARSIYANNVTMRDDSGTNHSNATLAFNG